MPKTKPPVTKPKIKIMLKDAKSDSPNAHSTSSCLTIAFAENQTVNKSNNEMDKIEIIPNFDWIFFIFYYY